MTTPIIQNFEKMLDGGKDNTLLRFSLGSEYLKTGDPVSAANHLKQAVVLDPKYSAAWKLLGRALVESGQPADALVAYREGIAVAEAKGDKQAAKEMTVYAPAVSKSQLTKIEIGAMKMADEFDALKAFLTWEESAEILLIDASHGIARAQRLLAMRYLRGRGVPKDEAVAFYWMQLAAQQHFAMAQRSLGELYENGFGIALNLTLASDWYCLAALQGDSTAKKHLQRLAQPNPA